MLTINSTGRPQRKEETVQRKVCAIKMNLL